MSVVNRIVQAPTAGQLNAGLLLLRLVVGVTFILHGGQKLFVYGFDGVAGAFAQAGIPQPGFMGPLVALTEFFGGIALALGLLTRVAALGIAAVMAGATLLVHFKSGFFLPNGYEYALSLFGSAALLTLAGAGDYSVDARLARRLGTPAPRSTDIARRRAA